MPFHYIKLGFRYAFAFATIVKANIQAGFFTVVGSFSETDAEVIEQLVQELQQDGSRRVSASAKRQRRKKSSNKSQKANRPSTPSALSPHSSRVSKTSSASLRFVRKLHPVARNAPTAPPLTTNPPEMRFSSVGQDYDAEYLRISADKNMPSILARQPPPSLKSLPDPEPRPRPVTTQPAPAPIDTIDPVVEDSRLRKELHEREAANRASIFAMPTFVKARLEQGLPAWEPSGDSGLTPELLAYNRQRETARILDQHRRQRAQQERQRLTRQAATNQKKLRLVRLHEIGRGLQIVLEKMSVAYDAGDQVEFGRLSQLAAVEGLKPASDILVELPMQRFDVFCIEWPLERLDAVVALLKQHESEMPVELATQLVDFVQGVVACGVVLGAALKPVARG
jgi:hypothetical protein